MLASGPVQRVRTAIPRHRCRVNMGPGRLQSQPNAQIVAQVVIIAQTAYLRVWTVLPAENG